MKQIATSFFLVFVMSSAFAQKFSGQWTGSFIVKGDTSRTEYVLEIDANGTTFEGTSITYFMIKGKRYYTICGIKGSIEPGSKTLVSTEIKKIKANTPPGFNDCFQTHVLTYFKKGDTEQLMGTWRSARKEDSCGTGTTLLERKALVKNIRTQTPPATAATGRSKPAVNNPANITTAKAGPGTAPAATATRKPVAGSSTKPAQAQEVPKTATPLQPAISKVENKTEPLTRIDTKPIAQAPKLPNGLERRDNRLFETITITDEEITISLFDNAEVDGDIITVLFNDEVVVWKQLLSEKPITMKLKAVPGRDNTLIMYAENQGRIPPNTAIMRVQSGENYYKIFLSADDKRNASVVFRFRS